MGLKICIIEDDEGIQDVLKIILKRAGYETNVFSDGRAFMDSKCAAQDLFLIDKQLPGVDGLTICKYLKDHLATKAIPVIMMSAYPNTEELSILAGADDFIEKPFTISVLLETLKKYIQPQVTQLSTVARLPDEIYLKD